MKSTFPFSISNEKSFEKEALALFNHPYKTVKTYRTYCELLGVNRNDVSLLTDIPFLPIQFFKNQEIIEDQYAPEVIFTSSGTTGMTPSKHYVASVKLYEESFSKGFEHFYGNIKDWVILALLPSYLERGGSSLVYMFDHLIRKSNHPESGFYLNDYQGLIEHLDILEKRGQKTLLLGVSYALLDLVEMHRFNLDHTIIMETGGMKGRRKEMVKEALHEVLKDGFGVTTIHSEYGMTELLSQAYSKGHGIYECPPWMMVLTRDPEDPFTFYEGKTGGINVIDLANRHSCAFIETQDLGKRFPNGDFQIMGRFDSSDIRGCNLMVL